MFKKVLPLVVVMCFFVCSYNNAHAEVMKFDKALYKYKMHSLQMPEPEEDGMIPTINNKGDVLPDLSYDMLDDATKDFISKAINNKVLEIGGTYGNVLVKTLSKYPYCTYHLNDIDRRNLFITANKIKDSGINTNNIRFLTYDIAGEMEKNQEREYDTVLISRVLNFIPPEQLDTVIKNLYNKLVLHGTLNIVAITPYVKRYATFIPEYERRVSEGEEYPGYVESLEKWADKSILTDSQIAKIPEGPFMFLDENVLIKHLEKAKFTVLSSKTSPMKYKSKTWYLDGREHIEIIARKDR